jgi:hypothetical protein
MRVGVPREIKPGEHRVGLTPIAVREYVGHGHEVLVETGAGQGAGYSDEAYRKAGAAIAPDAEALFARSQMIVKVKEPQKVEWARLTPEHILFTYLHLAPDPDQTEGLLASGCAAIAYETVTDARGGLPLLAPMSEVAGRSTILARINAVDPTLAKDSPETRRIIDRLKELEHEGYQFEAAESSFELVVRKMLGRYQPFFELVEFKVIVNEPCLNEVNSSVIIKVRVGDQEVLTVAAGDGPVNALDKAARKALERLYPAIGEIRLTDYKVRVLDSDKASAARVRVLIESTDGRDSWTTIGVSTDIINASWQALVDAMEYKLLRDQERLG